MLKTFTLGLWGLLGVLVSCAVLPADEKSSPLVKKVVEGNTKFAVDLYHQLDKENKSKNLFFSPYSLSVALTMTGEATRGNTQKEIGEVLHFPEVALNKGGKAPLSPWDTEVVHQGMGPLFKQLNAQDKGYEIATANALWGEKAFPFRKGFSDALRKPYGIPGIYSCEFTRDPDGERQRINKWGSDQTRGLIPKILPEGSITSMTRLVLTNAIYFKGTWQVQFDPKRTKEQPFTLVDGSKVKVQMMHHPETYRFTHARVADHGGFQILRLPYEGGKMSMVVLLPDRPDGLSKMEQALTAENLNKWMGNLRNRKVVLGLPKLKMKTSYEMKKTLSTMGMPDAFSGSADFRGLNMSLSPGALRISNVYHKAFVDINEEGTEAAAVTAIPVLTSAKPPRPETFIADRPYLFLIRHEPTGSLLFVGRVMNPTM